MKKVLIIAYHFPPSNEVAIHRVLRMGKWLPNYNWIPVILTTESGFFYRNDETNRNMSNKYFKHIYKVSSLLEKMIVKNGHLVKKNRFAKAIRFFLNNILIPDRYALWYNPAVKKGLEIIEKEKIDAIWATLNPYTSGLVGAALHRKTGVPLLIDYRDPWTLSEFHRQHFIKQKINTFFEKHMLKATSAISATSEPMRQLFIKSDYFPEESSFVLTNCYDEELQYVKNNNEIISLPNDKINITYTGTFYKDRQPFTFIEGIKELFFENPEYVNKIRINFVGNINNDEIISFCKKHDIISNCYFESVLPYTKAIKFLLESDILLLLNGVADFNEIFIPGKLFDYLAVKKPILFIGGNGAPAEIIKKCNIGECCTHDKTAIKNSLLKILERINKYDNYHTNNSELNKYNASATTLKLVNIFDSII
ncbi:MAG TPA: glycosyltransferase [bacterium]|nr:glycosyltransferase [bacterium]HPN42131.1 glycosyltransferase [bacterium]